MRSNLRYKVGSLVVIIGLVGASVVAGSAPAGAYETTGCKWGAKSLRIDQRLVAHQYRYSLGTARNNYNASTDVTLSLVEESGPSFKAQTANYGATGYEARANWTCVLGKTNNATVKINQYYLSGDEPSLRLKVVWAHELGHALGLGHVSIVKRVMYTSATTAYRNGVTALTSDDIAGINALY